MNSTSCLRLGIDLGSTSIGWCILKVNRETNQADVLDMGSRIFSDGRDPQSQEPLAVQRRNARSLRRRRDRKLAAKKELIRVLVENGLFPPDQQKQLEFLDPYELRSRAVDSQVNLYELGRVFIHLLQRRGFKSNLKVDRAIEEENQGMKLGIKTLESELGDLTLGQYLYRELEKEKDQKSCKKGIRFRPDLQPNGKNFYALYASREMYESEIDAIWSNQQQYHEPTLSDELLKKIKRIIISQRPLKEPQIGKCAFLFDEGELRARLAYPVVQRFRILQECNNLNWESYELVAELLSKDDKKMIADTLSYDPRIVKNNCNTRYQLTFHSIYKKLLKVKHDLSLNLDTNNRKFLLADSTTAQLSQEECFGRKWFDLSVDQQNEIIDKLMDAESYDELIKWLLETHDLTTEHAENVCRCKLAEGYGRLSVKAIERIVPHLENGLVYSDACQAAGFDHAAQSVSTFESLPYYGEALPDSVVGATMESNDHDEKRFGKINNPTVHIGLNQLRKVVNKIIDRYGKPDEIVVELARDLKLNQKQKKELQKVQKQNKKKNEEIEEELSSLGLRANWGNRMKYKLWEDLSSEPQHRCCPFCGGNPISIHQLFSPDGQFEVEHLLPFSITYDDSRGNKVISCRSCNRKKGNRSPFEAFGSTEEWNDIVARADLLPNNKKWRFQRDAMEQFQDEGGIARLLNDTRYLSRVACKYLKVICDDVSVTPGQLTAMLRHEWGLNQLLDEDEKNRGDHRHHAIDAFVIANTTRSLLQSVSRESSRLYESKPLERQRLVENMPLPFEGYSRELLQTKVDHLIVSHKLDRGNVGNASRNGNTTGRLHEESYYGFIRPSEKKDYGIFAIRKPIKNVKWSKDDLKKIADQRIRKKLLELHDAYGNDPKLWQTKLAEYGEKTNVRRLRVHSSRKMEGMISIEDRNSNAYRYAVKGSNYCADFIQETCGKKKGKISCVVTSTIDAHQKNGSQPIWKKENPTARVLMRLQINDCVAVIREDEVSYYRVKKIYTDGRVYVRSVNVSIEEKDKLSFPISAKFLQQNQVKKAYVDELGKVFCPQ